MFPIHDETARIHGRPYVNYGLIAVNVIVFIWEALVTGFFTDIQATNELFNFYGAVPHQIIYDPLGSVPSIFTSMFMHGGIAHIIGNMIFLFVFGANVEDRLGRIKYLLLYLGWGAFAAIAYSGYMISAGDDSAPAIGASGAISGVLGAYLLMFPRSNIFTIIVAFFITTVRIPAVAFIPFWFIMQVIFVLTGQSGGGVAYAAHVGGFVAGVATGFAWRSLGKNRPAITTTRGPVIGKKRPRIEDAAPVAAPEVIEGPNFYEVIAEIRGISDASNIHAIYEPNTRQIRITTEGPRKYDMLAKLPDTAINPTVEYIHYLNGIARIRLTK